MSPLNNSINGYRQSLTESLLHLDNEQHHQQQQQQWQQQQEQQHDVNAQSREDMEITLNIFGRPYGRDPLFWKYELPLSLLVGAFMGLFCVCFFGIYRYLFFKVFFSGEKEGAHEDGRLSLGDVSAWSGRGWWVAVTCLGGFLSGCISLIPWAPGLGLSATMYRDMVTLHGHTKHAPFVIVSSLVSLSTGMSIGPEQALSAAGAAFSTLLSDRLHLPCRTHCAVVLAGIAAALGALFKSPFLGVVLLHEISITARPRDIRLDAAAKEMRRRREASCDEEDEDEDERRGGNEHKLHDYMEQTTIMGASSVMAFLIFRAIFNDLNKKHVQLRDVSDYEAWHLFAAIPIGILCGVLGTLNCLFIGTGKKIRMWIMKLLHVFDTPLWLASLILATFAGLIQGVVTVAFPLTLGSGIENMQELIRIGFNNTNANYIQNGEDMITARVLGASAFFNLFGTSVPIGIGIVGGQLFPVIYAGVLLGFALPLVMPALPITLTLPCCMSGIFGSYFATPMTATIIPAISLGMTPEQAAPVLVCVISGYIVCGGLGVLQDLGRRQLGNKNRTAASGITTIRTDSLSTMCESLVYEETISLPDPLCGVSWTSVC